MRLAAKSENKDVCDEVPVHNPSGVSSRTASKVGPLPPLEPYPFLSVEVYATLSADDRTHIRLHNQAIKDAMTKMQDTKRTQDKHVPTKHTTASLSHNQSTKKAADPVKSRPATEPTVKTKTEGHTHVSTHTNVSVEVRILLIKKEVFLFGLIPQVGYSVVLPIENKEAINIHYALRGVIMESRAKGFHVVSIITDHVTIMSHMIVSDMLADHSITVTTVKDEAHMVMTTQRIYLVEKEWNALAMTLKYVPSKHIIQWGVISANRSVNMRIPAGLEWAGSPRHAFLGTYAELDPEPTSIKFGSYVHGPGIHMENDPDPRSGHIFLSASDRQPGKSHILNLRANTVMLGYHGEPRPITGRVIRHLNYTAFKDGYFNYESSPSSFTTEESVKWSDGSHNNKTRHSLNVEELPSSEPYLMSPTDYSELPETDKDHIQSHNQAIKDAMERMQPESYINRSRTSVTTSYKTEAPKRESPIIPTVGSEAYPYWSPITGDELCDETRDYEVTIVPDVSDDNCEVKWSEQIPSDGAP